VHNLRGKGCGSHVGSSLAYAFFVSSLSHLCLIISLGLFILEIVNPGSFRMDKVIPGLSSFTFHTAHTVLYLGLTIISGYSYNDVSHRANGAHSMFGIAYPHIILPDCSIKFILKGLFVRKRKELNCLFFTLIVQLTFSP